MGMNLNYTLESPVMNELLAKIDNLTNAVNAQSTVTLATQRNAGPGELITAKASIASPVRDILIYGCSRQKGTPTPSSPKAITSVTSAWAGGRSLVGLTIPTISGVTITENADGSITVTGTVPSGSNPSWINASAYIWVSAGTYTVSGCPEGGGSSGYRVTMRENTYGEDRQLGTLPGTSGITDPTVSYAGAVNDDGAGCTFTLTTAHCVKPAIRLAPGYEFPSGGLTFRLILQQGSDGSNFEAYEGTEYSLSAFSGGIGGIPVSSGGNYTDESGQQWICDTIDLGKGVYTKRVNMITANGGTNCKINGVAMAVELGSAPAMSTTESRVGAKSNRFTLVAKSTANLTTGEAALASSGSNFNTFNESGATDNDGVRAWFSSNPTTFVYALATPVETALTAEQIAQLRAISMIDYETWMYNDGGSGMKARYNADIAALLAE